MESASSGIAPSLGMRGARSFGSRGGPGGRSAFGSAKRSPNVCSQITRRPSSTAFANNFGWAVMGMRKPGWARSA